MNKKGGAIKTILIVLVLVVLVGAIYFTFFYAYSCDDKACFMAHQEECSRTKYTNEDDDAVWKYHIKGKEGNNCVVNVKLERVKEGNLDLVKLQGKEMDCSLPLGITSSPEADISRCHGLLKEGMQDLIINNLYAYILDNVGEIDEGLKNASEII